VLLLPHAGLCLLPDMPMGKGASLSFLGEGREILSINIFVDIYNNI